MIGSLVTKIKKIYDRQQNVSWFYRTEEQNHELGKQLAEQYSAMAKLPAADRAEDSTSLPSPLNEARQAYENQVIMSIQRFTAETEKPKRRLSEIAERGISNLSLMRADLFYYLSVLAKIHHFWWFVWPLFIGGLLVLSALDFAPTMLVFQSLMSSDQIEIGSAFGLAPADARSYMLLAATLAFLVMIVSIGHVSAKFIGSSYLDGEVPVAGWALAVFMIIVFVTVSGIRFEHEQNTAHADYNTYIMALEKEALTGNSTEKPTTEKAFVEARFWSSVFHSGIFVIISLMIFIVAGYLSLWRVYGDIRMIVRRHKHIKCRILCSELDAEMQAAHNALHYEWENLRQSAQLEVEQVHFGVNLAMHDNRSLFGADTTRQQIQSLMHRISRRFSELLKLPQSYKETSKEWMPTTEETWGLRYSTFFTEIAKWEAFYKGALDGMYTGTSNPDSVPVASFTSNPKYSGDHHPAVSKLEIDTQYEAGFKEGCKVPHGAGWLLSKSLA